MSISLGIEMPDELDTSLTDIMRGVIEEQRISPDYALHHHEEGIDFIPANIELSGLEFQMISLMGREHVDDIYALLIDNQNAVISMAAINAIKESGAHICFCDRKHTPASVALPMSDHYRPLSVVRSQLEMTDEFKAQIWKKIIVSKMVFFDLQVKTKAQRKQYTEFRKYLINEGYTMVQYSVYSRTVRNSDDAAKYVDRIRKNLPPEGSVRVMTVTEKQYASMEILVGEKWKQEDLLDSRHLIEL